MKGASVILFLVTLAAWESAAFFNNRPFPTYSLDKMPSTQFSCREKILGGYYADPDTQCQMFHICVKVAGVGVQDFRFLCPNGTAFDQDHQICADWEDVDCDATTLYYSSDNFDLYRIGSGFESKSVKYGEDEEPFALQRAETGDVRINREHQTQQVNQQNDKNGFYKQKRVNNNNNNNNNNNERDIFKGSSSSNFFNNRNNGKENDEDYDDNVNINQNRDYEQKRKIVRKQNRRPVQQNRNNNESNNDDSNNNQNTNNYNNNNNNNQFRGRNNQNNNRQKDEEQKQDNVDAQTTRPQRPTGFVNNFAGSSYVPTTTRSTTINNEQPSTQQQSVNRGRHVHRQRLNNQQYNNNNFESAKQANQNNSPTPTYTISTPAPFRQNNQKVKQTTQYNNNNNNDGQYYTTTIASKKTENYPKTTTPAPLSYNTNYDVPKVKQTKTENYPSNNPQYSKQTTPFANPSSQQYSTFDKKQTTLNKQGSEYPTTFSPKPKPFSAPQKTQPPVQQSNPSSGFPTTFAPRTNAAYTQITQQTNFNKNNNQKTTQLNPATFNQQFSGPTRTSTQKSTPFTQYTPTVPKITSTTPVSRSNRFDETQYDDGSYSTRYDYDGGDEFLKTAHSQNIASSRNELSKSTKVQQQQQSTKASQQSTKAQQQSTQRPYNNETPRPFSVSPSSPRVTNYSKTPSVVPSSTRNTERPIENIKEVSKPPAKKVKDVSYDYAYYDSNLGSDQDYQIDTEIKKSTVGA